MQQELCNLQQELLALPKSSKEERQELKQQIDALDTRVGNSSQAIRQAQETSTQPDTAAPSSEQPQAELSPVGEEEVVAETGVSLVFGEIVQVVPAATHTICMMSSGKLLCWGSNEDGQLGLGDMDARLEPCQVAGLEQVAQFAAGSQHTVCVCKDGSMFTWGDGISQLCFCYGCLNRVGQETTVSWGLVTTSVN